MRQSGQQDRQVLYRHAVRASYIFLRCIYITGHILYACFYVADQCSANHLF